MNIIYEYYIVFYKSYLKFIYNIFINYNIYDLQLKNNYMKIKK